MVNDSADDGAQQWVCTALGMSLMEKLFLGCCSDLILDLYQGILMLTCASYVVLYALQDIQTSSKRSGY